MTQKYLCDIARLSPLLALMKVPLSYFMQYYSYYGMEIVILAYSKLIMFVYKVKGFKIVLSLWSVLTSLTLPIHFLYCNRMYLC